MQQGILFHGLYCASLTGRLPDQELLINEIIVVRQTGKSLFFSRKLLILSITIFDF